MDNKYKLHGAFSWCELLTTDVPEAKRFYSKLFGWALEAAPIPGMEYTLVKYGGEQMGGIHGHAARCRRDAAMLERLCHGG